MSKTSQITQLPLEAVPDAVVVVDGEGQIIQVNTQTEKLFGYSREELLGRSVEMLIPARLRDEHIRHRTDFFTHPSVRAMGRGLDLWGLSKDGQEFPVEISLSPFEVKGELLVTAAIRDISERNRTEETIQILLRLSEKLNSMRDTDKLLDTLIQEAIGLTHAESSGHLCQDHQLR